MKLTLLVIILLPLMKENPSAHVVSSKKTIITLLVGREEKEIKKINGDLIVVHAQVRICPFYEKQGYIQFGQIDDDEGVPHMWMKKKIQY